MTQLPQGGDAHTVVGAIGEKHHRVAGSRLSVKRVGEDDLSLGVQIHVAWCQDLFRENHAVGQTCGDAADLHRDRDGRVFYGEIQPHTGDHLVLGEAERLGQRIAAHGDDLRAPDHLHHRHADDTFLDDAFDAGDDHRVVDLNAGPGRVESVVHFHDAVAVAYVLGDNEGRAHAARGIRMDSRRHHLAVAADGHVVRVGLKVRPDHGDPGLPAPADVRGDLHRRVRFFEYRIRVDVLDLGPVGLFDEHTFRCREERKAALEQCVARRGVYREHSG